MAEGGLEGVVAGTTTICDLDGVAGVVRYQGIDLHELADHSTFEEVAYLLWNKHLPNRQEFEAFKAKLVEYRALPRETVDIMRAFPKQAAPMEVLRTAASALSVHDPKAAEDARTNNVAGNQERAALITSRLATIVATWEQLRNGREPITPRPDLNYATNFLYMMQGREPDPKSARDFDIALILHADHELNAGTFAARVTAATLADMYAAVTSGIGTLGGPLHGGANEQVTRMLQRIGSIDKVEEYIKGALERRELIMGFGHRVYRVRDPRARHLSRMSLELGERIGDTRLWEMTVKVEDTVKALKGLHANVDLYSGSFYYNLGIPIDQFTPIFAMSRVTGWTAHILEQYANNRLIRPRAEYVGPRNVPYVPIDERS